MVAIEIRFEDGRVNVRQFGRCEFNRWTVLNPGDVDRTTGWSFEELRGLGEGVWEFPGNKTKEISAIVI